jgi:2-hydroxyisoflavanone synthase
MLVEIAVALLVIALFIHLRPTPTAKSKALRHLPNPPSPKPRLPFIGHLHLLDNPLLHHSLIRLGERYGPLYSLYFGSMPTVVASTPDLFKLFLQTHEATSFNTRFQTSAIRRLTYDNSVAMVPFGPYWKFIRKLIMNDLLNATTVNKLRPLRSKEIHKVLKIMANSAETQQPLNVTEELLKWTNSTISTMMLGEAEEVRDIARDVLKIFGEYSIMDFIGPLKIFKKFGNYEQRIDAIFNKYDPIIEKVIKKRQEIVNKRRSGEILEGEEESVVFLDTLLEYAQDETMEIKITKEQIKGLVVVSFFSSNNCFVIEYTYYILGKITSTNGSSQI